MSRCLIQRIQLSPQESFLLTNRKLKKEGVNLPRGIFKAYQNVGIGGNCKLKSVKKAEGGRIGFAAGGYDQCMNDAIQEHNKNLKRKNVTIQ